MDAAPAERVCGYCGGVSPPFADFCLNCHRPLTSPFGRKAPNPGGGIEEPGTPATALRLVPSGKSALIIALVTFLLGSLLLFASGSVGSWAVLPGLLLILAAFAVGIAGLQISRWRRFGR